MNPVLTDRRAVLAGLAAGASSPALADDLEARARRIHAATLVLDSHLDIPLDYGTGGHDPAVDGDTQVDLPKLERGGVGAAAFAVFVPQGPRTPEGFAAARVQAETKLAAIRGIAERYPLRAALALSPDQVLAARKAGKVAVIPSFLNAYSLGTDLSAIDSFVARGVRVLGFVHAGNNDLADSSRPSGEPAVEHGGLSPLGKAAVGRLNALGVLIDVSQLTPDGVLQTLALSRAPVVATHSGVRGVVDVPRNLSDRELDAIAAKGGVVQIVAFKSYLVRPGADYADKVRALRTEVGLPAGFVKPGDGAAGLPADVRADYAHRLGGLLRDATVADLADSIDYAVKRIGIDHVGVGSDFNHGGGVTGWRNAGEAFGVTRELVRRGYSQGQVGKIWGGNFLRAWRGAEAAKA
ncbi:dipeptidase [Phenylobacterium aquaticum]|uniref:dipeptidase n=1 Tax=Phenylobacterium aquaticum TaxID=1763816 RepID=UPI0026E9D378|nr:dipeptidase [Phenylobacterium aquaticum]